MLYIASLVGLLILSIIRMLPKKRLKTIANYNYDDYIANIRALAISLRSPDAFGIGISHNRIIKPIDKAIKIINKKRKKGFEIYEYEKWIVENSYIIFRYLNKSVIKDFNKLPHVNTEPRILNVARAIVNMSKNNLNADRICMTIKEFNKYTPLFIEEIYHLKIAIIIALAENVCDVAKKVKHYYFMNLSAINPKFNKALSHSDCYIFNYLINHNIDNIDVNKINARIESAQYSYTQSLNDNELTVKNAFSYLMIIEKDLRKEEIIKCSYAHSLMCLNDTFNKMCYDTKVSYLNRVKDLSSRLNYSEQSIINTAFEIGKKNDTHFGIYLMKDKKIIVDYLKYRKINDIKDNFKNKFILSKFLMIYIISAIISGLFSYYVFKNWLSLLLFIPFFILIYQVIEHLTILIIKSKVKNRIIGKMDYAEISDDNKTMVVISEFINSNSNLDDAVKHMKEIGEGEKDKNILISLLIDFESSKDELSEKDKSILNHLKEIEQCIDKSKYNIFIRKKIKDNDLYIPYERKRGAILNLCNYLIFNDGKDFIYVLNKDFVKPKFIVLLDDDNVLLPQTIKDAVNTMLHPLNEKYDLLAFNQQYNLYSLKTYYSKKYLCSSGIEQYPSFSNYYYNLTGKSIYCGKGIFKLENYYNKLKNALPDKKVLSHDIIEGAILNTGLLNNSVYEDAPLSLVSDEIRRNRWLSGDVKLLMFIKKHYKNKEGKRINNKIDYLYKFIILSNFIKYLIPITAFSLIISSLFLTDFILLYITLGALLTIPLLELILSFKMLSKNIILKQILKVMSKIIYSSILNIIFIPFYAVNNFIIILNSTITSFSKKRKPLKWITFKASQNDSGFLKHTKLNTSTIIVSSIIALFLNNIWFYSYALFYILLSQLIYFMSKTNDKNFKFKIKDMNLLREIASKTFNFFIDSKNGNSLICDNLQIKPNKGKTHRTSPTNIGFSILAMICGAEFNFIDYKQCYGNIIKILKTVDKLKKWNGHLYNWYDTETLDPLTPFFVSSVDSANFICCLIIVRQYFLSYKNSELDKEDIRSLICIIDEIIDKTDFLSLYDDKAKQFYIGYNSNINEFMGHYDLLASEAQLLSIIGISKGIESDHWFNLNRDFTSEYGNTLLSWSGTMFEYMLPQIFINISKYSMIGKTIKNVAKIQSKTRCAGLFGISECGYYKFDSELNYQYYAYGINELSLKDDDKQCIISPYSSFLALNQNKKYLKNIRALIKEGAYSEYGFYESIDYSSIPKHIIFSYMAHHQGMILASLTNILYNNILANNFSSYNAIASTKLLLTEQPDLHRHKRIDKINFSYTNRYKEGYEYCVDNIINNPVYNVLNNFKVSYLSDERGIGYLSYKNKFINRVRFDEYKSYGNFFYIIDEDNNIMSPTLAPLFDKKEYSLSLNNSETVFLNKTDNIELSILIPPNINCVIKKLKIKNIHDIEKKYTIYNYSELSMNNIEADISHPVFNNLFIHSSFSVVNNTIVFHKKSLNGTDDLYYSVSVKGMKITPETNRFNFIGRCKSPAEPIIFKNKDEKKLYPSLGDTIEPCLGYYGEIYIQPHEYKEIFIYDLVNEKEELLNADINMVFDANFYNNSIKALNLKANIDISIILNENKFKLMSKILYEYLKNTYSYEKLNYIKYQKLNNLINTEYFPICINYDDLLSKKAIELLDVLTLLKRANILINLFIVYKETDTYHSLVKKDIIKLLSKYDVAYNTINIADVNSELISSIKNCCYSIDDLKKIDTKSKDFLNYANLNLGNLTVKNNVIHIDDLIKYQNHSFVFSKDYILKSGEGGLIEENAYLVEPLKENTLLPYTNVICGEKGGFIITENGNSMSYNNNSREDKITVWNNDSVEDTKQESLYLIKDNKYWCINSINDGFSKCIHGIGYTQYLTHNNHLKSIVTIRNILNGKCKIYKIELFNTGEEIINYINLLYLNLSLSWKQSRGVIKEDINSSIIKCENVMNNKLCYVKSLNGDDFIINDEVLFDRYSNRMRINTNYNIISANPEIGCILKNNITPEQKINLYYIISSDYSVIKNVDRINIEDLIEKDMEYYKNLSAFKLDTGIKSLNILFNNWLPYQIISSRLNGRCGYYQVGGAIGFRDQLQDCLALLYSNPEFVRKHILKCAEHQYIEGDVMHWWHEPDFGVRTTISDDRLFLVYLTSEYITVTGDEDILKEKISYLLSEPLKDNQKSRVEIPKKTEFQDSLYNHCIKAIDISLQYGENDLLLIKGGDWNDAFDEVGDNKKGESVWLAMFAYFVINKFLDYIDIKDKGHYIEHLEKMKKAVNANGFNGKWFNRAFTSKGQWLGNEFSDACKIDLICQAFSAISGITTDERVALSLKNSEMLIDYKSKIIKLLTPPFKENDKIGYICEYPEGIRENGGQYTHSAVWYIMALCKSGSIDKAFELLQMINPLEKCRDKENTEMYKGEPYVLSADVYSEGENNGRMGWSFYTGSASWLYKAIIEDIIGIKIEKNCLVFNINLPKEIKDCDISYRYKNSIYNIKIRKSDEKALIYNGIRLNNTNRIDLSDDIKSAEITVLY